MEFTLNTDEVHVQDYSSVFRSVHIEKSYAVMATFHLTILMREQLATGKIRRNNYHHGNCGPSLTDKTSSVSLIFTHQTHRNVKDTDDVLAVKDDPQFP